MSFYFITGLPRSRTAWLANYLTHNQSMCYHDELMDGPGVLECTMRKAAIRFVHVGHADPANLFCWRQLDEAFLGEAKWIFVRRPFHESMESVGNILGRDASEQIYQMVRLYSDAIMGLPATRHIQVPWDMKDADLVRIENFLFEVPIVEPERRALLKKFNVQIESSIMQSAIKTGILKLQKGELKWVQLPS